MSRLQLIGRHRDAANAADTAAVAGSIGNVNSVAGSLSLIAQAVANLANINAAAANEANINLAVANESNIDAVAANEAAINAVNNALPDIITAVNGLTRTESILTLSLGSTEAPGSVYESFFDAIVYAKTVLQPGGKLTLNIPDGTYAGGANSVLVDSSIRVDLVGIGATDKALRVITSLNPVIVDGSFLSITNLTIENSNAAIDAPTISLIKGADLFVDSSKIEAVGLYGAGIQQSGGTKSKLISSEISADLDVVYLQDHDNSTFEDCTFTSTYGGTFPSHQVLVVSIAGQSKAIFRGTTNTLSANKDGAIGVSASENSNVARLSSMVFNGTIFANYDPVIDTYGNNRSYISS